MILIRMASSTVIMEFRTVQATVLKNLFESIKEILVDINMVFTKSSIHCTAIDGSKSACVHFYLDTKNFEEYACIEDEVIIGINMSSLHKLIKPISNGDIVMMKIFRNDRFRLHIVIENTEKHTRTTSVLKLLDIDQQILTIPDVVFDNIITMPCSDFQRHCKDMMAVAEKVTFACTTECFVMKCTGDFAEFLVEIQRMTGTEKDYVDTTTRKHNNVAGTFSLKYINLFIKSSNLCANVEIYLKKHYPLILVYKIGSLGKIQFVLAPDHEEQEEEGEAEI